MSNNQMVSVPLQLNAQQSRDVQRFYDTCEDGQGYDVPKDRMKTLARIGLVGSLGFGRYEFTDVGDAAVNGLRDKPRQPAQHHQGEPVAWLNTATGAVTASPVQVMDWDDESEPVQALYTHADPAEVKRLRAALKFYADREHYHFESGNWDTVSGEPLKLLWCGDEPDLIEDGTVARNALSVSAEPSAPVEIDERAAFERAIVAEWPQAPLSRKRDLLPKDDPCYGDYCDEPLQRAWVGWQARAALERKP